MFGLNTKQIAAPAWSLPGPALNPRHASTLAEPQKMPEPLLIYATKSLALPSPHTSLLLIKVS